MSHAVAGAVGGFVEGAATLAQTRQLAGEGARAHNLLAVLDGGRRLLLGTRAQKQHAAKGDRQHQRAPEKGHRHVHLRRSHKRRRVKCGRG
eukprot:5904416-Pleurochrysis_carterae.AAC.1